MSVFLWVFLDGVVMLSQRIFTLFEYELFKVVFARCVYTPSSQPKHVKLNPFRERALLMTKFSCSNVQRKILNREENINARVNKKKIYKK